MLTLAGSCFSARARKRQSGISDFFRGSNRRALSYGRERLCVGLAVGIAAAFVILNEFYPGKSEAHLRQALFRFGLALAAALLASEPCSAQNASDDAGLKAFAVHINRTPRQAWPGYGIYLGNGLIITAAHVPANVAETKPHVIIAGQDLPAALVKQGSFDEVDLTLLSVDAAMLPVRLQMRRMPICERPSYAGEEVIVAIPEGVARSRVLPPAAVPRDLRGRFDTVIGDVATTGNSGSGVFDARNQCLLGIISRKISVGQRRAGLGPSPTHTIDIAKYFVPASVIKAFIPPNVSF